VNGASWRLRPASTSDVAAIAAVWHAGWADGHLGHVPDELVAHRSLGHFLQLVPSRITATTVAIRDGAVVGFVTVHDDEIEQVYVHPDARGTGVAGALLDEGERSVARGHRRCWLAVVAGNDRARRFYERQGWRDDGPIDYEADVLSGTVIVPARRYVKDLA
jgi:ribosomal protein S18 acetylase RimI-like enzyme